MSLDDFFPEALKQETKKKAKMLEVKNKTTGKKIDPESIKLEWDKSKDDWIETKTIEKQPSETNPFVNSNKIHHQKHKLLNLKWGSTSVYKVGDEFYGWGDIAHNLTVDIIHNMLRLRQLIIKNNVNGIYKCYDSDMGITQSPIARVDKTVLEKMSRIEKRKFLIIHDANQHGEQAYRVFETTVELLPENKIKNVDKVEDSFPTPDWYEDTELLDENGFKCTEVQVIDIPNGHKFLDRVIIKHPKTLEDDINA